MGCLFLLLNLLLIVSKGRDRRSNGSTHVLLNSDHFAIYLLKDIFFIQVYLLATQEIGVDAWLAKPILRGHSLWCLMLHWHEFIDLWTAFKRLKSQIDIVVLVASSRQMSIKLLFLFFHKCRAPLAIRSFSQIKRQTIFFVFFSLGATVAILLPLHRLRFYNALSAES
jgi:hypothetical protein